MSTNGTTLGQRLRTARETAGISTRAVSTRMQVQGHRVSHTTLCAFETDKITPTIEIVSALAQIYGLDASWFNSNTPLLTGTCYRCLKSVKVSQKQAYQGAALGWLRAYIAVENALDRPLTPMKLFRNFHVDPRESGETVAKRIREMLKLDIYPVPSVVRLAENFGIRVIQLETESRIDGFAAFLEATPVMVVNPSLSNDRIRINIAHELAHHLFRDCSTDGKSEENDLMEARVFECGSFLLMPDSQLKAAFELQSMVRLVQYKERFGLSLAAMIYRAKRKKYLDGTVYEQLWKDFARLGWRQREPGYVAPDRPIRMEALFDAAIRSKRMSEREIARVAGVDELVVRARILRAMGAVASEPDRLNDNIVYNFQTYKNEFGYY